MSRRDAEETRAWIRGLTIAKRLGYNDVRDCRLIAMGYSAGWMNAKRTTATVRKTRSKR